MRAICGGVLVLASAGLLLSDARGQTFTQNGGSSFLTGVNPMQINPVKVDPQKALRTPNLTTAFPPARQQKPIGLGNVFPKISLGSWPPTLPNMSMFPSRNQFQPGPTLGVKSFK
jgi:hypothetical protein